MGKQLPMECRFFLSHDPSKELGLTQRLLRVNSVSGHGSQSTDAGVCTQESAVQGPRIWHFSFVLPVRLLYFFRAPQISSIVVRAPQISSSETVVRTVLLLYFVRYFYCTLLLSYVTSVVRYFYRALLLSCVTSVAED